MHVHTFDSFYPRAKSLRAVFDRRFANPLATSAERFQWDYWHVPGEFTNIRTPAYHYFPKSVYEPFHRYLVNFGRTQLGCHDISPPWLSCYVEGCRQEPHQDLPHGPLAYVFSLTNWNSRAFRGGETFIVKPKTLIEPKFNRLTIFNPWLTHGVRQVRGTQDPREGRLVIHGWFVNPRPFWVGPLEIEDVREAVEVGIPERISPRYQLGRGLLSLRLTIRASGRVQGTQVLFNSLLGTRAQDLKDFLNSLTTLAFAPHSRGSKLTLPLMVE